MPQVVVPLAFDQFEWATAVAAAGKHNTFAHSPCFAIQAAAFDTLSLPCELFIRRPWFRRWG